jgi:hypothetical protein
MATLADIIRNTNGAAGSGRSWHVERVHRIGADFDVAELWHYSTLMLVWRVDQPTDDSVLDFSTGHGSVSDQGGMNTAFRVLGLPYYFSRAGGAEIRYLDVEPARRQLVNVPWSEAAMHCGIAGRQLFAIEESRYCNGAPIPLADRRGCRVVMSDGRSVPMLKSEAGWADGVPVQS